MSNGAAQTSVGPILLAVVIAVVVIICVILYTRRHTHKELARGGQVSEKPVQQSDVITADDVRALEIIQVLCEIYDEVYDTFPQE